MKIHAIPYTEFRCLESDGQSGYNLVPISSTPPAGYLAWTASYNQPPLTGVVGGGTYQSKTILLVAVPADYVFGAPLYVGCRAKIAAPLAVHARMGVVARVLADGVAGGEQCQTPDVELTTAFADYLFSIAPNDLAPGKLLQLEICFGLDDTGGNAEYGAYLSEVNLSY